MALAVSIGEPPPKPIRQSYSPPWIAITPFSTIVSVGSGMVSLNTPAWMPACSSGSRQFRTRPEETMNGSVTTSGRDRPNLARTSAIWRTVPPPTSIMRGEAILAIMVIPPDRS